MAYIKIEIEVKNPEQVIAGQKGQLIGLASKLMKKEKKHQLVQRKIYEAMIEALPEELNKRLDEEGVDANFNIEIKED